MIVFSAIKVEIIMGHPDFNISTGCTSNTGSFHEA